MDNPPECAALRAASGKNDRLWPRVAAPDEREGKYRSRQRTEIINCNAAGFTVRGRFIRKEIKPASDKPVSFLNPNFINISFTAFFIDGSIFMTILLSHVLYRGRQRRSRGRRPLMSIPVKD
jgi:hypothetical protein